MTLLAACSAVYGKLRMVEFLTCLYLKMRRYSIAACALIQQPEYSMVGTGENNNQRSVAYGEVVYKSEDGGSPGKTWD